MLEGPWEGFGKRNEHKRLNTPLVDQIREIDEVLRLDVGFIESSKTF